VAVPAKRRHVQIVVTLIAEFGLVGMAIQTGLLKALVINLSVL
jgi:hypothetical protein